MLKKNTIGSVQYVIQFGLPNRVPKGMLAVKNAQKKKV